MIVLEPLLVLIMISRSRGQACCRSLLCSLSRCRCMRMLFVLLLLLRMLLSWLLLLQLSEKREASLSRQARDAHELVNANLK